MQPCPPCSCPPALWSSLQWLLHNSCEWWDLWLSLPLQLAIFFWGLFSYRKVLLLFYSFLIVFLYGFCATLLLRLKVKWVRCFRASYSQEVSGVGGTRDVCGARKRLCNLRACLLLPKKLIVSSSLTLLCASLHDWSTGHPFPTLT